MSNFRFAYALFLSSSLTGLASAQQPLPLSKSVESQLPSLTETYKDFHRNPELSHHEEQTSAKLAADLRQLGFQVTEHIGKYQDGSQAWGVVALM